MKKAQIFKTFKGDVVWWYFVSQTTKCSKHTLDTSFK